MAASRVSGGIPAGVEITPPHTTARRPPVDSTMPKPVEAVPGSIPSTRVAGAVTRPSFSAQADVSSQLQVPARALLHLAEPEPHEPEHRRHQLLARHLGMAQPPLAQRVPAAHDHL